VDERKQRIRSSGFETVSSRVLYDGDIITLVKEELRLPDGTLVGREVVRHPGAVGVVAITPEGEVVLVEQYRQPLRAILREIPAGKLSEGEAPDACAIRELAEETGYRATGVVLIGEYFTTPGFTNERFHMFLARDLEPGDREPDGEEERSMNVVRVPFDEALADARAGRIEDGKTLVGLLLAAPHVTGGEAGSTTR
jgi:ADP-ribose pyrophosphatase